MNLARIDGTILAPACHPSMSGARTVICQPLDENGNDTGTPVLAIDTLGAALHQRVLLSTDGSRTRELVRDNRSPLRNHVLGIVDDAKKLGIRN